MTMLHEDDLGGLVLRWIEENNRNPDENGKDITKDLDLLSTGMLDSIGFIELIGFVEQQTNVTIDLSEVDLEEFSTVAGLCRYAVAPR